jgi:O-antigen/teichoic acid export membrane protein
VVAMRVTARHTGMRPRAPLPAAGPRPSSRAFWGFSATRGVTAAVEILLEWFDVLLVGALTSARDAGVYAVVTRCARAGEVVQQAARVAVGPQISAALARGDRDEARTVYGLVTAAMIWLAWPFFIVLAVFPHAVLSLFGPGFGTGAPALTLLAVSMALATAAGTVQTIVLMGGRSSWQLADKTGALALNVVLNLVLVPACGITGAAAAWAITILVDTCVVVAQVQRLLGVRPEGRPLVAAAALSLSVVGAGAVVFRLLLGDTLPAALTAVGVLATAYLAASWPLRRRLGLVALAALR